MNPVGASSFATTGSYPHPASLPAWPPSFYLYMSHTGVCHYFPNGKFNQPSVRREG